MIAAWSRLQPAGDSEDMITYIYRFNKSQALVQRAADPRFPGLSSTYSLLGNTFALFLSFLRRPP
jgi:hypothetical protein